MAQKKTLALVNQLIDLDPRELILVSCKKTIEQIITNVD